ncbi:MAG: radical SAM protein [Caldisericia bacterium]|nr:radical SAM protein [Caldisericia bacterium]
MSASYLSLSSKEIKKRGFELFTRLSHCDLCPRECRVNRILGKRGFCQSDYKLKISTYSLHFGEERPISGFRGSGTIFFTNCSLKCNFCQNYSISQLGEGEEYEIEDLAKMMLNLQNLGAHNINLVTPTHYSPHIILAISISKDMGLKIPILYNTSGYEKVEILKYLEGIVDIYLPDAKYGDKNLAKHLSDAENYPEINIKAIKEMVRQVGFMKLNKDGIIEKGVIVRHLILPNNVENSKKVLENLYKNIGKELTISLMTQYYPCFKALGDREIGRRITRDEFLEVLKYFKELGFKEDLIQYI